MPLSTSTKCGISKVSSSSSLPPDCARRPRLRQTAWTARLIPLDAIVAAESNGALQGCQRILVDRLTGMDRAGSLLTRTGCRSCLHRLTAASTVGADDGSLQV